MSAIFFCRHLSYSLRMYFNIAPPTADLAPFVKKYWGMESCAKIGEEHVQRIIPGGMPEMIFYFGQKPKSLELSRNISESSSLNGHLKSFYDIQTSGKWNLFSILFKPQGLMMLFDTPAIEFHNLNVPLRFLIGEKANEIEDQLEQSNNFSDRVNIIEAFLRKLLVKKSTEYNFKRLNNSLFQIISSNAPIGTDNLASTACLSRKQFERIFSELIGNSPKQMLKTIRFQKSIHLKSKNPDISLTQLAYASGYYDQSHMISDFKQLSGHTPAKFFSFDNLVSDFFE